MIDFHAHLGKVIHGFPPLTVGNLLRFMDEHGIEKSVILPLVAQHQGMLQRNLLYTAVTRGTRLVVLVGSRRALAQAVGDDRAVRRFTALRKRLAS